MNNKSYIQFITDLKKSIIQSRCQAARLANREQLILYYQSGKMLFEKVKKEKWGVGVFDGISEDLIPRVYQINLFSDNNEAIRLYQQIDSIKNRFGEGS